ncbi:MAG: hypothetical protein ABI222_12895 [Opitutaceae bacterium]
MRERHESLSPKLGGPGGHLWTVWADWGLVAKVGLGFVGAIALFVAIQFYFEHDNQKDSFAAALTTLANVPLDHPLTQRQARLLKHHSTYSWRAILWVQEGTDIKPRIWQTLVLHEGKNFRCLNSELFVYEKEKARSLELFEDVSRGPQSPETRNP